MKHEHTPLTLARWVSGASASSRSGPAFMFDRGPLPARLSGFGIVQAKGDLEVARARIAAGADRVLLADSVLKDIKLLGRAVQSLGEKRVGVWLPVQRMAVGWALDAYSNGDFKCMVPSNPEAAWEVLTSTGEATGTEAGWWIEQVLAQGASTVLVSVDMDDDRDLNICAGLLERFGEGLWFSPRTTATAKLGDWIEYGQVRRLVLPERENTEAVARALLERYGHLAADPAAA